VNNLWLTIVFLMQLPVMLWIAFYRMMADGFGEDEYYYYDYSDWLDGVYDEWGWNE